MQQINQSQQMGMQISIKTIKDSNLFKCDCGKGISFTNKIIFKKISPIMSPTGKEELYPIPVMVCDSCGKIPSIFNEDGLIPDELIAKKEQ